MNTYTIPAMTTAGAAKWAAMLDADALRQIADWCEEAAGSLRGAAPWAADEKSKGELIADCSRFELTAAHLRGLIKTVEG